MGTGNRRQGIFWALTIRARDFTPFLPRGVCWIRGQLELSETGYLHWQIVCALSKKGSLRVVRGIFGDHHADLTYSEGATEYVWKEDTRVGGTQFELGIQPIKTSSKVDWERVWSLAKSKQIDLIPAHVRVQSYRTLKAIGLDYLEPVAIERTAIVFFGPTRTGKSHRAWTEAGMDAYPKDPRTKFWDGYRGQRHVIFEEFCGVIDITNLLRWVDKYPVIVEVKGSSTCLLAERMWFTSNIDPRLWYPDATEAQRLALFERLEVAPIMDQVYVPVVC